MLKGEERWEDVLVPEFRLDSIKMILPKTAYRYSRERSPLFDSVYVVINELRLDSKNEPSFEWYWYTLTISCHRMT